MIYGDTCTDLKWMMITTIFDKNIFRYRSNIIK